MSGVTAVAAGSAAEAAVVVAALAVVVPGAQSGSALPARA